MISQKYFWKLQKSVSEFINYDKQCIKKFNLSYVNEFLVVDINIVLKQSIDNWLKFLNERNTLQV